MIGMNDVTRILQQIESGDRSATDQLLPIVYEELRRLATQQLSRQLPGQTLQPTALVHEAYLRLVHSNPEQDWNSRGHFFVAAAEAMRRILVENVRQKQSLKRGGEHTRIDVEIDELPSASTEDLLAVDEALKQLEQTDLEAARLVELRYFSGLTMVQASEVLGISVRSADRLWAYAKAWLLRYLRDHD